MSHANNYAEEDSEPPFDAREKSRVRTDWKTIGLIIIGGFTAGSFYMSVRALSEQQSSLSANQVRIAEQLGREHDTIRDVQSTVRNLDTKIDYLVGGRRGPAPITP